MFGLFSDECGAHHWGDWTGTGEYRVENDRLGDVKIVRVQKRSCQHDCSASETRTRNILKVSDNDFNKLVDAIDELSGPMERDKYAFQRATELIEATSRGDEASIEHALNGVFTRDVNFEFEERR